MWSMDSSLRFITKEKPMGIFDGVEKSSAQKRYERIKENSPRLLAGEKARCTAMFNELWGGATLEEAQATLDLFGAEAFTLFQYHSAWQTFLQTIDPNYEWLTPPFKVDVVEGRVVLSEIPKPEPTPEEPEPTPEPEPEPEE